MAHDARVCDCNPPHFPKQQDDMVVAHVVGGGGVAEPMVAGRGEEGKRGGTVGTGVEECGGCVGNGGVGGV